MRINSVQQYFSLEDPYSQEALDALMSFCFEASPEQAYQQRKELGAIDALTMVQPMSKDPAYLEGFHSVFSLNN
jgi:hypothetical protein